MTEGYANWHLDKITLFRTAVSRDERKTRIATLHRGLDSGADSHARTTPARLISTSS